MTCRCNPIAAVIDWLLPRLHLLPNLLPEPEEEQ